MDNILPPDMWNLVIRIAEAERRAGALEGFIRGVVTNLDKATQAEAAELLGKE